MEPVKSTVRPASQAEEQASTTRFMNVMFTDRDGGGAMRSGRLTKSRTLVPFNARMVRKSKDSLDSAAAGPSALNSSESVTSAPPAEEGPVEVRS